MRVERAFNVARDSFFRDPRSSHRSSFCTVSMNRKSRAASAALRTGRARRVRVPPQDARQFAGARARTTRERIVTALVALDLDADIRGEALDLRTFAALTESSPAEAFSWPRSLWSWWRWALHFTSACCSIVTSPSGCSEQPGKHHLLHADVGHRGRQYLSYLPLLAVLLVALPWASGQSLPALGLRDSIAEASLPVSSARWRCMRYDRCRQRPVLAHASKARRTAITLFTSTHDTTLIIAFTFLATIAAPFMEELVYRGFLFNALARYLPVWVAAIVSVCSSDSRTARRPRFFRWPQAASCSPTCTNAAAR